MIDFQDLSPRAARDAALVTEIVAEIRKETGPRLVQYLDSLMKGTSEPVGPMHELQLQCVARLGLLIEYHEIVATSLSSFDPTCAMRWKQDAARLTAIAQSLVQIDSDIHIKPIDQEAA